LAATDSSHSSSAAAALVTDPAKALLVKKYPKAWEELEE
jgi:hypothetical protein